MVYPVPTSGQEPLELLQNKNLHEKIRGMVSSCVAGLDGQEV